jgi:phage-related protein
MAKREESSADSQTGRKPIAWLRGEIKTPPFSSEARQEAGDLLRLLQEGERIGMPQAEPHPIVGPRCGALRIRDEDHNWRIVYRTDADAVVVMEVYDKKSRRIPDAVINRCQKRLTDYDVITSRSVKRRSQEPPKRGQT